MARPSKVAARFRQGAALVLAVILLASWPARAGSFWKELNPARDRSPSSYTLSLNNLHTGEHLDIQYRTDDRYDPAALARLNVFLRDFRTGDARPMDARLIELLYQVKEKLRQRHPGLAVRFDVISGYRTVRTNNLLRLMGGSQAKDSQHIQGKAIDIRVPGVALAELRDTAWCLHGGGVGYYAADNFVHIDTASIRYWNWSPASDHTVCSFGYLKDEE